MPGASFENDTEGYDPQDQSEAFDETSTVGGDASGDRAAELRTFEELPDLVDLTRRVGDREDDDTVAREADALTPDALDDADLEEDNELDYRAATAERQDDLDELGPEDAFDEGRIARSDVAGGDQVLDAGQAEGAEDDVTDFESRRLDDDDLSTLGYAEEPERRR
ncbi:MAG: hypothetical protein U1C74_26740 [Phenylobacterium sp.]|nr:hypothetical protein [Phenylobacterium sp.]